MCISKVLLLAKEKKSKFKIKRKKTPISPTPPKNNEKLSRLKILREAFFEGHITKKELGEGIEELRLGL
ncbi:MAG: hypothetical protein AAB405_00520 [Patescibacteria group bacterium]